jgi:ribosomal protein L11 methyltransferase
MQYFNVRVELEGLSESNVHQIVQKSFEEYKSIGVEDLNLDEASVDELLGDRSYCGGLIPEEIYTELDTKNQTVNTKTFYFDDHSSAIGFLQLLIDHYSLNPTMDSCVTNNDEWLNEWKKEFKPIKIKNEINIYPNWMEPDDNCRYNLSINPGMGFGTGHHETTKMCLELGLDILNGQSSINNIFDYGSGSGILGLLMTKIKPKYSSLVLFDIDHDAAENSLQNAIENQLMSEQIKITTDYNFLIESNKYDLIFANILLDTLLKSKTNIMSLCSPNTHLVVSGLLNNQVEEFLNNFNKEFKHVSTLSQNDWSALYLVKL